MQLTSLTPPRLVPQGCHNWDRSLPVEERRATQPAASMISEQRTVETIGKNEDRILQSGLISSDELFAGELIDELVSTVGRSRRRALAGLRSKAA